MLSIREKSKFSAKVWVFHLEISSVNNFRRLATLKQIKIPITDWNWEVFYTLKFIEVCSEKTCKNSYRIETRVVIYFFLLKDFAGTKSTKSTKTQRSKSTERYKRTKIITALKKHLRGKKPLIRLFGFLCFLYARKENRKKREVPIMLSIGAVSWCVKSVWAH